MHIENTLHFLATDRSRSAVVLMRKRWCPEQNYPAILSHCNLYVYVDADEAFRAEYAVFRQALHVCANPLLMCWPTSCAAFPHTHTYMTVHDRIMYVMYNHVRYVQWVRNYLGVTMVTVYTGEVSRHRAEHSGSYHGDTIQSGEGGVILTPCRTLHVKHAVRSSKGNEFKCIYKEILHCQPV